MTVNEKLASGQTVYLYCDSGMLKSGGPEDSTIIYHITAFGSRRECTEEEIFKRFGRENPHRYWPESIPSKACKDGKGGETN